MFRLQLQHLGEGGKSSALKTNLYSVESKSLSTGFKILNLLAPNEINLSHCYALVISEELAKSGINPYFDMLADNVEVRATCNIIVSNNTAQNFLDATSKSEDISAKYYNALIGSAQTTSYISRSTLYDFYASLHDEEKEATAIYGYTDGENILDFGTAIFKNDKYVSRLSRYRNYNV